MQTKLSSQQQQQQQQHTPQPFDSYRQREQQQQQQLSSVRRSGSPLSAAALDAAAQAEQQLSEQQQQNCMTLVDWNPVQEPSWLPPYQVPAAQQQQQAPSSRRQSLGQPNSSEQQVQQQQQQPGGWCEHNVPDLPCNNTRTSFDPNKPIRAAGRTAPALSCHCNAISAASGISSVSSMVTALQCLQCAQYCCPCTSGLAVFVCVQALAAGSRHARLCQAPSSRSAWLHLSSLSWTHPRQQQQQGPGAQASYPAATQQPSAHHCRPPAAA
jgi:hypothetical protein